VVESGTLLRCYTSLRGIEGSNPSSSARRVPDIARVRGTWTDPSHRLPPPSLSPPCILSPASGQSARHVCPRYRSPRSPRVAATYPKDLPRLTVRCRNLADSPMRVVLPRLQDANA
jgi:hypothetical protein